MRTRRDSEVVDQDRRELRSTAALGIAAAAAASLLPLDPAPAATSDAVRPFRIDVPEQSI
jgi:hypothetical protein